MIKIRAERRVYDRGIGLYVVDETMEAVGTDVTMTKVEAGQAWPAPTLTIDITASQALMDELWDCGLRPSEGSGSAGSLAATERHLEDMRALVFKGRNPWQEK